MASVALWSGQYDDALTTYHEIASNTNYPQFNGTGRVWVRFDASASGLDSSVKSVTCIFCKYGQPTGNITVGIRKTSDDSLVTIITVTT